MLASGTVIGAKYCLVAPIGQGGMGMVWRAAHLGLASPVAIKIAHPEGEDAGDHVKRFLREARVAASVHHRNVVDIRDFGVMPSGEHYMVMELLEGESLADRIDFGKPFSVHEALRLMIGCLRGLGATHAAGIIHRDLKPENIFLSRTADRVVPKLVDFGISRSLVHRPGVTFVTKTGMILGTPHYMSPEQARGAKDCDARADLYSMGVILYEVLTRRLPFEGDNVAELLTKVWTGDPVDLATRRPELKGAVSDCLHIAIARRPEDRFGSAIELREALEKLLPVIADFPGPALAPRPHQPRTRGSASGRTTDHGGVDTTATADTAGAAAEATGRIGDTTDRRLAPPPSIDPLGETHAVEPGRDRLTTNVDGMAPAPVASAKVGNADDGEELTISDQTVEDLAATAGATAKAARPTPPPLLRPPPVPPPRASEAVLKSITHLARPQEASGVIDADLTPALPMPLPDLRPAPGSAFGWRWLAFTFLLSAAAAAAAYFAMRHLLV